MTHPAPFHQVYDCHRCKGDIFDPLADALCLRCGGDGKIIIDWRVVADRMIERGAFDAVNR